MKYFKFLLILLGLLLAIYYYFGVYGNPSTEPKIDEQSSVTVTVTPIELNQVAETWKFELVLDTHSGSLDEDLMEVATLVDDQMNIYTATSWEGTEAGGHHREGILSFDAIEPLPKTIELKIKGIGGIDERSFKWPLQ